MKSEKRDEHIEVFRIVNLAFRNYNFFTWDFFKKVMHIHIITRITDEPESAIH